MAVHYRRRLRTTPYGNPCLSNHSPMFYVIKAKTSHPNAQGPCAANHQNTKRPSFSLWFALIFCVSRGGKATLWEGGVRGIGFVVAGNAEWLGVTTSATINRALIHVTDWLPTLCDPELADCPMAGGNPLDGVSAWHAIAHNGETSRNEIVVPSPSLIARVLISTPDSSMGIDKFGVARNVFLTFSQRPAQPGAAGYLFWPTHSLLCSISS